MPHSGAPLFAFLVLCALLVGTAPALGTDTLPPWAVNWGPTGTDVPTDTMILVVWSESMNWVSVEAAFSYSDGAVVYTAGTWTIYDASNMSVFAPAIPLQPGTRYTVKFRATAADLAGNPLDQNRNGRGGEAC